MIPKSKLTAEERQAVDALERVAQTWPESLWLFSGSGTLYVMRYGPGRRQMMLPNGGVDPAYIVGQSINIRNDGGDW